MIDKFLIRILKIDKMKTLKEIEIESKCKIMGLKIHNNCMRSISRSRMKTMRLSRQLEAGKKAVRKMEKISNRYEKTIWYLFFSMFKPRHKIWKRQLTILNENVRIAELHDKELLLLKHNYNQHKLLK